MMNYIQAGQNLTLPAPYDVDSGSGALVGSIFGVSASDALSGADMDLVTVGVFTLPKVSTDAFTVGAKAYWDNTAKLITTTSGGNTLVGVAVTAAANPSGSVSVRLNGSF